MRDLPHGIDERFEVLTDLCALTKGRLSPAVEAEVEDARAFLAQHINCQREFSQLELTKTKGVPR